jgi:hypothetical protein
MKGEPASQVNLVQIFLPLPLGEGWGEGLREPYFHATLSLVITTNN